MDDHDNKPLSSEKLPELPEEIIEEILSRQPAKSLLKFRCVSKSWRSLISSKLFIKTHLQNISRDENHDNWRVLYYCDEHGLNQRSLQSHYDEPSVDPSPFDDPKNNHLMTADVLGLGHCNGVLCIVKDLGCFFLWNPTLRISIELPKIDRGLIVKCGFGWDEGSDAYKVFAVFYEEEQAVGKVYSTKTNSWKTVDHGCLYLYDKDSIVGKFTSGKFHWLMDGGLRIETFDLSSEAFGVMDHPFKPKVRVPMALCEDFKGRLGMVIEDDQSKEWDIFSTEDINGRLGMFAVTNRNKKWKIWSMEKYGVKESWVEKIFSTSNIMPFTNCLFSSSNRMTSTCCHSVLFYKESLVSLIS